MPKVAAEIVSGGHDFKTSLMAGFEKSMNYEKLYRLHCAFLQPCIQMDADTDDHGEEGIPLSGMDSHIMQMVVVEDAVIYPFTGSTVIINFLIFIRAACNGRIKTDVPFRFCVNAPAIRGRRTFLFTGAGIRFAAGKGTAPFAGMLLFAVAPVDHTQPCHAKRGAVCVNGYGVRDGTRFSAVRVEVNEGADLPFLAKPISGIIIMGGVQADIPDRDIRVDSLKFPEGDDGADAVVPPGIQKADMQGQVNTDFSVVCAEHVKSMAKIKNFFIAVPAPVGLGI